MPTYLILDIAVEDPADYAEYLAAAPSTVETHGGRYLVRGGATEKLSGDWDPERVVVLEFPSRSHFDAWYNSPEYQAILPIRERATRSRVIVVEGVAESALRRRTQAC